MSKNTTNQTRRSKKKKRRVTIQARVYAGWYFVLQQEARKKQSTISKIIDDILLEYFGERPLKKMMKKYRDYL